MAMDLNINFNQLKTLPPRVQLIIGVVPSVILIVLFFFFVYSPKSKEIGVLNEKIAQIDKQIAVNEEQVRKLDALIVENTLLKKKLAKLQEQLPEEKEVSVLLKQISDLGLTSGLQILLWKPEARKTDPSGLYVEIPVKVEVLAEYHRLGDFLSQISRLPRLVNITDMSLKVKEGKGQEGRGIIGADFTARTFASVVQETPGNKLGKPEDLVDKK
ncbi:MAG: type 4a pilus biogenesis protein PilO [Nitrospirae bacterium]|nr:type 4a pilus biogenesis protein PilO [Nitrospirota bacterium]